MTIHVVPASVRSWPRAIGLAAVAVWAPGLVILVLGPLRGGDHCVGTYAACLPIVPGVILPVLCNFQGAWAFFGGAAIVTLTLLAVLAIALRELPRRWSDAVQGITAALIAAEAWSFASLLRM